jgi:hypothetical protein
MQQPYNPYAAPETRHPVQSAPLTDGKPAARPAGGGMWPLGIVLLVFGALGWIAGGKYTVEGWVVALNMFGRWVGVTQQVPLPRGWWLVAAVILSGLVYSRVELLAWRKNAQRMPQFWIGWVLIVLTDVGSTLLGVLNPQADAAPVFLQLAAMPAIAVVWALVLTAAPEYLILGAIKILKR